MDRGFIVRTEEYFFKFFNFWSLYYLLSSNAEVKNA
jgi:hypothetical protein